jgi:DNA-binding winged helix-turn-helix (wHTH) protein/tetratricopeptide (TPR) repeat protein/type II secretory pathway predicted ATPase ExeA
VFESVSGVPRLPGHLGSAVAVSQGRAPPVNDRQQPRAQGADTIDFLSFQLDRRAARLTQGDNTIPLRPKTWAVLLYLAERPGALVTSAELLDAVWPNVSVTPSTLTKSIAELRVALNDEARRPHCIETVHRRGFRFIAKTSDDLRRGAASPDWSTRDARAPTFVGREAALARLGELFAKAYAGERQIVFVTGEAGVGKTTLVERFLDSPMLRGSASPVWVARGVCIEQQGAREAYMPVLAALEELAHRPDAERLVGLLRRTAPTWLVQMPWLLGDDADVVRRSLDIARPERMLREVAILIEALTTDVALIILLEDLHWSDPSTIDLLSFLAQRRKPARLLVLGTYRASELAVRQHALSSVAQTLKARRCCTELPLHDLSEEELRRYLGLRFPGADFAPELAAKIHEHTGGNPLFVTWMVELALRRGWILETEPGWALTVPLEKLESEVPDDTRQMIAVGFDSLRPEDRALLEAASVVGVEFDARILAAALERGVDEVDGRCGHLARAHWFLRVAGDTEWPDGSATRRYAFTHTLYRRAAYAETPEGRRQRLHQRIGEALEAAYGERASEIAAVLAIHFEHSCDHTRVVRYLAGAAALARQRFANREAISYLKDALARVPRLPDEDERRRQELGLLLALAPALGEVHGYASEQLRENCDRAYKICVGVGSAEQLFQILYSLCYLYCYRADKALGPEILAKLDDLGSRLGTREHRLVVDTVLIRTAFHSGRFIETCRLAEERMPGSDADAAALLPFVHGPQHMIAARYHVAVALWMLGHTERARKLMDACLAAARESRLPATLIASLWFAGFLEVLSRKPAEARQLAEQALALSEEQGFEHWYSLALVLKGWVLVETGLVREGIEFLKRARAANRASHGGLMCTHTLAFQAEGHRRLGEFDAGLAAVDEALAAAEATLDRSYWPELWRIKGELLLAAGSATQPGGRADSRWGAPESVWHEAERCLQRALEMAREWQAKSLELRAATSLSRAWHARGRTPEARALLTGICQWFRSDDENVDLAEARALLDHLAVSRREGMRRRNPSRTKNGKPSPPMERP